MALRPVQWAEPFRAAAQRRGALGFRPGIAINAPCSGPVGGKTKRETLVSNILKASLTQPQGATTHTHARCEAELSNRQKAAH